MKMFNQLKSEETLISDLNVHPAMVRLRPAISGKQIYKKLNQSSFKTLLPL